MFCSRVTCKEGEIQKIVIVFDEGFQIVKVFSIAPRFFLKLGLTKSNSNPNQTSHTTHMIWLRGLGDPRVVLAWIVLGDSLRGETSGSPSS